MKHILIALRNIAIFLGFVNVIALTSCKNETKEVTVPVTGISLNLSEFKIQEGVEYHLTYNIIPENATNKQVVWGVSNLSTEGCVEIDAQSGLIKPIKSGTALITVTALDGNFTASCNIEIVKEKIPVESISIDEFYTIVIGENYKFNPIITPTAPSNSNLVWSLDNVNPIGCLTLNEQTGEITAIKEGSATVNVTAADGRGAKASCEVTIVKEKIPATGITLNPSNILIESGSEPILINANILPNNATERTIVWEIVDDIPSGCISINNGMVIGVTKGKAKIKASIKGTDLSSICNVTVLGPAPSSGYDVIDGVWYIYTFDGLKSFRDEINSDQAVDAILVRNIDMENKFWEPIGNQNVGYKGYFDGNSKYISNLNIDTEGRGYLGLFAKLDGAKITDLGIESGIVDGTQRIGGIAGACTNNSSIINCYNKAKILTQVTGKNGAGAGGITGYCVASNIIACYNSGEIGKSSKTPSGTISNVDIGGITGGLTQTSTLIACYNSGVISHTSGPRQGGIVGIINSPAKIYAAYNVGVLKKASPAWAIAGGGNVTNLTGSFLGVYWANDIPNSNASLGINYNQQVTNSVTSSELNSQAVVDAMNNSILKSANKDAAEYEFVVGTDNYSFPILKKK